MASILGSSDEKSNNFKLMRLIVDGGTEALRKTFTHYCPGKLHILLNKHKHTLLKLKRSKIIKQNQWEKLYPAPPNVPNLNYFDITLLCVLLRNICGLSLPTGFSWDRVPNVSDHSREADIVRIKLFRNERFGHIPNTSVSVTDFNVFWTEISLPLVRLGIDQREIDRLENEQCGEEEVERVIKEWKKCDTEIMNVLNEIKDYVKGRKIDEESLSDDVLNRNLVSCNFKKEIELYYEKYTEGTREWVFEQFLTWFNDETSKNRAFVISGLAGMGKSVIAAVICKRFSEHVGACHFFQYNNSQYNNPNILLQSLAWQLCQIVPPYRKALIKKFSCNLGQSLNNSNIEGLFSILFKEPFSNIAVPGERILIVLDAIDESEYGGRDGLANLISNHLHKLPSCIRFLITTRPEKNLIDKFKHLNPLCIEGSDVRNLCDLKLVLQQRISSGNACTSDLIDSLAVKADGLMLYAFFLSEMYNDESSIFSIDSRPQGIEAYYESYFRRLERELSILEISEDKFFSLLSALAVANESLPEAFLETLLGLEDLPKKMQKVRKLISSLLVINEDKSISFSHKSVRDWLVDTTEQNYSVDVKYGHKIIFGLCVKKLNELKQMDVRDLATTNSAVRYSIRYWIPHILDGPEDPGKLEHFVRNYAADLEVVFASVCVNVDVTLNNIAILTNHEMYIHVSENTRSTVKQLFSLTRRFAFILREYPQTFLQNVVNEGEEELSSKASSLLQTRYKGVLYLEFVKKDMKNDALQVRCFLSGNITGIDLSSNHDHVVCCYKEGGIELFSLATGKSEWKKQEFKVDSPSFPPWRPLDGPWMLAHCIVFHPYESLIFPGRLDKALTLQGTLTSGPFQSDENSSRFTNCCFSSDNSRMVTNHDVNLIVWNVLSGIKERSLKCKTLVSFSFTASGNFLGTVDIEHVFSVYDITNDYNVNSIKLISYPVVEIISTFDDSWFCSVSRTIIILNHDLSGFEDCGARLFDTVLPGHFYHSQELQRFLQKPEQSWFSKVRELVNYSTLGYMLIRGNSVLIYPICNSISMDDRDRSMSMFSIHSLVSRKVLENIMPDFPWHLYSSISRNGNYMYFKSMNSQSVIICELDSYTKYSRPWRRSNPSEFPVVVRDGVILADDNRTPELWNSDLTLRLAHFDQLAGTKKILPVSDELIACVFQTRVVFFNVFTKEIKSETILQDNVMRTILCSAKYHVLAETYSQVISLWEDGRKVDEFERAFCLIPTEVRCLRFSPQGNWLALFSCGLDKILIFDVLSLRFHAQISIPCKGDNMIMNFFDDKNLLCIPNNQLLYFINVERGEILTCVDVGKDPGIISVCEERSIVAVTLVGSERFELIKVVSPR